LVTPEGLLTGLYPATYKSLFRDDVIVHDADVEIPYIARSVVDLTDGAVLVQGNVIPVIDGTAPVYIVSNGVKRLISGPATMDKYHFNWKTIVHVPQVLVDSIPTGAVWF
jgi:hypothetical protein